MGYCEKKVYYYYDLIENELKSFFEDGELINPDLFDTKETLDVLIFGYFSYKRFTVGIFTEYNDSLKKIEYKHPETIPDDFLHSLTYAPLAHEISSKFAVGRYGA